MLVGQKFGPFLIERELGAGAMGAVYRAKHLETNKTVAIKVMAPGLGGTNPQAVARFEREMKILEQLKHPNIVRLFGTGKFQGTKYFAMEYVQGDSLDRVMERRDRMTWEQVVDLGQQLCAALQHAHEKGIVHRDLKPSNLMILTDNTLKLTDFGIAKDIDVTALTAANSTVGTAAYMSPEQCKGERDLTNKSDLYSMGVVFYELITGKKPFVAENAMEMFMLHVNGQFERPSRLVPDLPVWLDNLICQLLEKKPEHRPYDAAMVSQVLGSIQEKIEAQQSAGVDAAKARLIDRPRGQRNADEEDRDAARALARGKAKAKKRKAKPWYEQAWPKALGIVLALGLIGGAIYLATRPPSAEKLYKQAEKLMASDSEDAHDKARNGPIKDYLRLYGTNSDEMTTKVQQWADDFDVARYEKLIARYIDREKKGKRMPAIESQTEAEALGFKAAAAEYDGHLDKAGDLWRQVLEQAGRRDMGLVAERHLALRKKVAEEKARLQEMFRQVRDSRIEPVLGDQEQMAFTALRFEKLKDWVGARRAWGKLKAVTEDKSKERLWYLLANGSIWTIDEQLKREPQTEVARKKLIADLVKKLEAGLNDTSMSRLDLRALAQDVAILYAKDDDLGDEAKKAVKVRNTVDGVVKGGKK